MKWTSSPRAPALFASILLFTCIVLVLPGCGSDDKVVAPQLEASVTSYAEPGEVFVPEIVDSKFPVPLRFRALIMTRNCIRLDWERTAVGYTAILHRDGVPLATIDAREGFFMDESTLSLGDHVYQLCYGKCNTIGGTVQLRVTVTAFPGRGDGLTEEG